MKNIITTKTLSIGFEENRKNPTVLHSGLELQLPAGELCCLLGPNGAGKSTLLRTLVGFQKSIGGEVFLENKSINNYTEKELSLKLSVVLTEKTDTSNLTVFEVVSLGRYPYTGFFGNKTEKDIIKIKEALKIVGLEDFSNRYVSELSDGEKQKVMIAKAFAQETPVIFLDEPTAFLDIPGRIEIMQVLRKLSTESKKTILIATHNLELALQFADRIWLLARDKELITGSPEDLVLQDKISSFFEKEGIIFEKLSGSFIIKQKFEKTIEISGCEPAKGWVSRALGKIEYSTGKKGNTGLKVEISEEPINIRLHQNNKEILSTSLVEKLVSTIKELKPEKLKL